MKKSEFLAVCDAIDEVLRPVARWRRTVFDKNNKLRVGTDCIDMGHRVIFFWVVKLVRNHFLMAKFVPEKDMMTITAGWFSDDKNEMDAVWDSTPFFWRSGKILEAHDSWCRPIATKGLGNFFAIFDGGYSSGREGARPLSQAAIDVSEHYLPFLDFMSAWEEAKLDREGRQGQALKSKAKPETPESSA